MSEIIPAILPKSNEDLRKMLEKIPAEVPMVHIDVVDGNVFSDPAVDFEIHFMIPDFDQKVDEWIEAGAKRVIVHKLTDKIRSLRPGIKVGLAVELREPLREVESLIPEVDFVQLMSIEKIGEQGHAFEPEIFVKIKELQDRFPEAVIGVDGGVSLENAGELLAAGVDRLVVGSAIFNSKDPLEAYIKFLEVLH